MKLATRQLAAQQLDGPPSAELALSLSKGSGDLRPARPAAVDPFMRY